MACQYFKPISISLSPNTEKDDVVLALKMIFQPWRWKTERLILAEDGPPPSWRRTGLRQLPLIGLEEEFKRYLGVKYAVSFNSGRSSLMAILNTLQAENLAEDGPPPSSNLQKDGEILLQAFTCNAVPNPILWSGFNPVFVDCDEETFNIDPEDLKRKITPNSRAVIVQHTFGIPAEMDEILEICRQNNLILIEDCAHSLGATFKGKKVGTFGKVAFFSFSRDKIISSVYGGLAVTNDDELAEKLKKYQEKVGYPSHFWILQQLLHPVLMNWLILPTYGIFGKYLLILFQWLRVFSKAVHWKEKRGLRPDYFPKRLPNGLAVLALNQFKKLERFNAHRNRIAAFYTKELSEAKNYKLTPISSGSVFLRLPVLHENAHKIIRKAWRNNILLGDWYTTPIAPYDTRAEKLGYKAGSCPKAEKLAKITLNLPTHINISEKNAKDIATFLQKNGD